MLPALQRVMTIELPEQADVRWVMDSLSALPEVVYVHRIATYVPPSTPSVVEVGKTSHTSFLPNDEFFGLQQSFLDTDGGEDADINMVQAWDRTTGHSSTRVCVVDAGIDYTHLDLGGPAYPNIKIVAGKDYGGNTTLLDADGHGTAEAGIIGALSNNGMGIAGIAGGNDATGNPGTGIVIQKVLDEDNGIYRNTHIAEAIAEAGDPSGLDCDVVNVAIAPNGEIEAGGVIQDAMHAAAVLGTTVAVASGNVNEQGFLLDDISTMRDHYVINVGATNHSNLRMTDQSRYGPLLDLVAPGTNQKIRTTSDGGGYQWQAFTSAAVAEVSGGAALIQAVANEEGLDLNRDDFEGILEASAEKVRVDEYSYPFGRNDEIGHGRLDAAKALEMLDDPWQMQFLTASGGTKGQTVGSFEILQSSCPEHLPFNPSTHISYLGTVYEIARTVTFPEREAGNVYVWGRSQGESTGWIDDVRDCSGEDLAELVPGTVTSSSAQLRSHIYLVTHARNSIGQVFNISDFWMRSGPSNIEWAYTVLGMPPGQSGSGGCSGPINDDEVGSPAISSVAGSYDVTSSGNIFGTSDNFTFVNQECSGDFEVYAKINSLTGPNAWAKAGIMARESLSGNAKNAFAVQTLHSNAGAGLQSRATTGGSTAEQWTWGQGISVPRWIRLKRTGNVFTASHSTNGTSWSDYHSVTVSMNDPLYVGLAVGATDPDDAASASFSNFSQV